MLIPLHGEAAEEFLTRASAAIAGTTTHIYVDTSLAMWLTMIGPASRAAFIDWTSTVPGRIHVPAWTIQEYYRHHRAKTLKTDTDNHCAAVVKAAANFRSHLRLLADGPLLPGGTETAFLAKLDSVQNELRVLSAAAKAWNYDEAAVAVIEWMNGHALGKSGIFAEFARLKDSGEARYAHDVPPGYKDRRKELNRYGDLLFWQDVIADARRRGAERVVVLTRDRKEDWYDALPIPEVGPALRRLSSRWEPIPTPHPMLTFEMRSRSGCELLLLDDLYLGAILWRADKARYGRFAAVALSMDPERLAKELAPPPAIRLRAAARPVDDRISSMQALALVRGVLEQAPETPVTAILAAFGADAPVAEQTVDQLTPTWIELQDSAQLALLSRHIYDMADATQPFAMSAARRLLEAVDQVDAEHASAIVGGMVAGAFYEGVAARNRPGGALLQEVYAWAVDPGCDRVLKALAGRLRSLQSAAVVLPSDIATTLGIRLDASRSIATVPSTLGQLYVGAQAVLNAQSVGEEIRLRALLAGRVEATVREIVEAIAGHYGLPLAALTLVGATEDELWTVAEVTGLDRFGPLHQPTRGNAALHKRGGPTLQPKPPPEEVEIAPTDDEDDADDYDEKDEE